MIVEIMAGGVYGSMALLADGWHMAMCIPIIMMILLAIITIIICKPPVSQT